MIASLLASPQAPDGRCLINTLSDGTHAPFRLILSWNPEAKQ
jgi:hypothetical protein